MGKKRLRVVQSGCCALPSLVTVTQIIGELPGVRADGTCESLCHRRHGSIGRRDPR